MGDEQLVEQPDATSPQAGPENGQQAEAPAAQEAPAPDLAAQLEAAQAQAAEYLDGWQRARAELANYRKRVERERADWEVELRAETIKQLLPVLDDFDRAMASLPEHLREDEWVSGVCLIYSKFQTVLRKLEVEEIDALGKPFDPQRHEAVMQRADGSGDPDHVIEVVRKGYVMRDRVLRPAMVVVAARQEGQE